MSLPRLISPGPRDNHLVLAMLPDLKPKHRTTGGEPLCKQVRTGPPHIRCTYPMKPEIKTQMASELGSAV
jgi:hypothetical protein